MAKYLLLIYGDQQAWLNMGSAESERIGAGHRRFNAAAGTAVLAGHELAPAINASTSLRGPRTGDHPKVTDGPFLETKEVIGGFYLIEVDDLDAAMRLAALLPETDAAYTSGVEIRPILESD